MRESKNSYKQIFKATSIFGGIQIFNIIVNIVRSKFVAVLLGPAGLGITALFTTTITLITNITSFGLGTSAVKNVAAAVATGDEHKLGTTVGVFRRLVWITGGLGFVFTLITAPWLSKLTFGSNAHSLAFVVLSITLLFSQISAGQSVILRGMRKIQHLAKASVYGSLTGLIISIPLYYFFKEKGIVPAIVLSAITTLLLSWFYASKIKIPVVTINRSTINSEGRDMLKMGILISLSSIFTIGAAYIVRIFIRENGGLMQVGLFTAGFAIINTYVGMVFKAMSTDYYPRLSSISSDNDKCRMEVNQQTEIALLILAPILSIFLVFIKMGVVLLYSTRFLGVIEMLHWATLGVFFKAISWSIAFLFLAKSDSKAYFWNEFTANVYMLILNILGYYYFGLTGLGLSYLVGYAIYAIQVYFLTNMLYGFAMNAPVVKIFIVQFVMIIICLTSSFYLNETMVYIFGCVIIIISCLYSWKELNHRMGIKQMILKKIGK